MKEDPGRGVEAAGVPWLLLLELSSQEPSSPAMWTVTHLTSGTDGGPGKATKEASGEDDGSAPERG